MTIIGVSAAPSGNRAFLWADSEVYVKGRPVGHRKKVLTNSRAGVAAALTGTMYGLNVLGEFVLDCSSFDDLLSDLPAHLWEARCEFDDYTSGWSVVAAGRCRSGWIAAAILSVRENDVKAERVQSFTYPFVPMIRLDTVASICTVAEYQMSELRKSWPLAGAGRLTVAALERDEIITVAEVGDFHDGRLVSRQRRRQAAAAAREGAGSLKDPRPLAVSGALDARQRRV
jgi:hypothetical protein